MLDLSIIIPLYNKEGFIKTCLESILKISTYSFEVIVVDDCSTDNSAAELHAINDSRIKYLRLDHNSGAYKAREIGTRQAQGQYVLYIDADDYINARALKESKPYFGNTDIIHFPLVCDLGKKIHRRPHDHWNPAKTALFNEEILQAWLDLKCGPSGQCARLLKKELALKTYDTLKIEDRLYLCEDIIFTLIYAYYATSYQPMKTVLYYYTKGHESSSYIENLSIEKVKSNADQFGRVFTILKEFFESKNLDPVSLKLVFGDIFLWQFYELSYSQRSLSEKKELKQYLINSIDTYTLVEALSSLELIEPLKAEEKTIINLYRKIFPKFSVQNKILTALLQVLKKLINLSRNRK